MATFTSDPQSVEIASGGIISMLMNADSSDRYAPEVHIGPSDIRGLSVKSIVHAAAATATQAKSSSGVMYGYSVHSIETQPVYLKVYDSSSAPTVGTDTPVLRFLCEEELTAGSGNTTKEFWLPGITFSNGIFFVLVTGIADSDATAVTASKNVVNIYYA